MQPSLPITKRQKKKSKHTQPLILLCFAVSLACRVSAASCLSLISSLLSLQAKQGQPAGDTRHAHAYLAYKRLHVSRALRGAALYCCILVLYSVKMLQVVKRMHPCM
ncbi:hypothetical protein J3F84DRAFT_373866 [Trichoderma pleuroticola]